MRPARASRASEVPPPTSTAPGSASSSSTEATLIGATKASSGIVHVGPHRLGDRDIAGAATEVARHVLTHGLLAGTRMLLLQCVRRDDLAGRADAALHPLVLDEGLDDGRIALRDAFDGEYLRAVTKRGEVDARADRDVVHNDGASATDADGTALLRPR